MSCTFFHARRQRRSDITRESKYISPFKTWHCAQWQIMHGYALLYGKFLNADAPNSIPDLAFN